MLRPRRPLPRLIPPLEPADVDPRSFGCPAGPYRLLVASHAPIGLQGAELIVCGFCRVPWPVLQEQIAGILIAERDRARLNP